MTEFKDQLYDAIYDNVYVEGVDLSAVYGIADAVESIVRLLELNNWGPKEPNHVKKAEWSCRWKG